MRFFHFQDNIFYTIQERPTPPRKSLNFPLPRHPSSSSPWGQSKYPSQILSLSTRRLHEHFISSLASAQFTTPSHQWWTGTQLSPLRQRTSFVLQPPGKMCVKTIKDSKHYFHTNMQNFIFSTTTYIITFHYNNGIKRIHRYIFLFRWY